MAIELHFPNRDIFMNTYNVFSRLLEIHFFIQVELKTVNYKEKTVYVSLFRIATITLV